MTITAASVEANGWVLALTISTSPGSFASYALDPDGSQKLVLTSSHAGFSPVAGVAQADSKTRSLIATKPLRLPVNPASPNTPVIDETDLGGGSIKVRIALGQFVYASDTGLSLTTIAGWRTGEGAQTLSVSNASTLAVPVPIFRWADVPGQVRSGSFDLMLVAFSHHPQGLAPVAAVKFTVTDGTTTRTVWTTALATDSSYGDALRCYKVTVDPATTTALTAGLLRCDAEIYPWIGAMRSTDAAGTRSLSGIDGVGSGAYGWGAQAPLTVAYDPAGTRYSNQFVFVDYVGGTQTPSAAMVATTLAGAKAVAATSRAKDITTAAQALYLANKTLPAANSQASATRYAGGAHIVLAAQTHAGGLGSTAVTTGISSGESWVVIEGDPADGNPRANCIVQGASSQSGRLTRLQWKNLSLELTNISMTSSTVINSWFNNVELRAKSGNESNSVAATSSTTGSVYYTRSRLWKQGATAAYGNGHRPVLNRAGEWSKRAEACAILGGSFIERLDSFALAGAASAANAITTGGWGASATAIGDAGSQEDVIIAWNDLRSSRGRVWLPAKLAAATAGTPLDSNRRQVFVGNLCERYLAGTDPFWSMGEDTSSHMSYNIIEANSFIGERTNHCYSDPLPTTLAETNTQLNYAIANRVANNAVDWAATKHDAFNDPQSAALRGSSNGYRPQMVETWSITYGVGYERNYDFGRHGSAGNFQWEYFGRSSAQAVSGPTSSASYNDDRSAYGNGANKNAGQGNYAPLAGSPLVARAQSGNGDRDLFGNTRSIPFASGAIEPILTAALAPLGARSSSLAGTTSLAWAATLVPLGALSVSRAGTATLGWTAVLMAQPATLAHRAPAALVAWFATLAPLSARHANAAVATLARWTAALPADAAYQATSALATQVDWGATVAAAAAVLATRSDAATVAWVGTVAGASTVHGLGSSATELSPLALVLLDPQAALHALADTGVILIPGNIAAIIRTLMVSGELRIVYVPLS